MRAASCLLNAVLLSAIPASAVTIAAVGDIMLGSAYPFVSELPPHDGQQLLKASRPYLKSDVVFGNLEGVLIDDMSLVRPCPPDSRFCFRFGMPSRYTAHLLDAGFNVLNLANNHMHDFEEAGRLHTVHTLDAAGLVNFGTLERRQATQILADGTRIGWVGFAPHMGVNRPSVERIREQVAELARSHDLVFMSMHVGGEGSNAQRVTRATEMYLEQDRGDPYAFAHAAIDAGADLVIGHGPHVLRGLELYRGRLIAYSLGNFSTYGRFNLKGPNGLTGVLQLQLSQDGEFQQGRFIGMRQDRTGAGWQDGISPELDATGEALQVLRTLSREDFPESPLEFAGDGTIRRSDRRMPEPSPEPSSEPAPPAQPEPLPAAEPAAQQSRRPAAAPARLHRSAAPLSTWQHMRRTLHTYYLRSKHAVRQFANY